MASLLGITFYNPLPIIARITSVLGDPRSYGQHEGYDLAAPTGPRILAAAPGTVSQSGYMPDGYGYYVEVEHGSGVKSLYGHMMSAPLVSKGETVGRGETLGYVGATGNATGPHLHFHIVANGIYQDVGRFVDLAVAGARQLAQQLPCYEEFLEGRDAWNECARTVLGIEPSDEEFAKYADAHQAETAEIEEEQSGWLSRLLSGENPFVPIIEDIEDVIYNVVFAPARLIITTFKLSDAPLEDGRATLEWLQVEKNAGLMAGSIVLTRLVLVLIAVALAAFLRDSGAPLQAAAGVIESPLTTAAGIIEG